MEARDYRDLVRPLVEGRKFILIGGPVAGKVKLVELLRELGAARPFVLGEGIGTGELPPRDQAEWHALEVHAPDIVTGLHVYEGMLEEPPAAARAAIEAWDPHGEALALGLIILNPVPHVAGRRRYGARATEWARLEDKVVVDAFWDAIGVPRVPCQIVSPRADELRAAAAGLDRGAGTVWAGDAREGMHGGATGLRWVRSEADADAALRLFGERCDRVRVMPFLDGIPCSIHGMVFPDGRRIVLRPVELLTLRRPGRSEFHYGGAATYWDPAPRDREEMRSVAATTADGLHRELGYRGPFTVDGVLTEQGFRPTELNPRWGAGLSVMARGMPELPLELIALAAIEGEPVDFRPAELEELLVTMADRCRAGSGMAMLEQLRSETETHALVWDGRGHRLAAEGEQPDASLLLGPSVTGSFMRFLPDPERCPHGPSLAPRVVDAFALADRELGTGLGALEPAPSVPRARS